MKNRILLLFVFFFIAQISYGQDIPNFQEIKRQKELIEKRNKEERERKARQKAEDERKRQIAKEKRAKERKIAKEIKRLNKILINSGAQIGTNEITEIVAYSTVKYSDGSWSITLSRDGGVETYFNERDGTSTGSGTSYNDKNKGRQHREAVKDAIAAKAANGVTVKSRETVGPSDYR